jgi:hypothetical protein
MSRLGDWSDVGATLSRSSEEQDSGFVLLVSDDLAARSVTLS